MDVPPLKPPPASHVLKPYVLWSRPMFLLVLDHRQPAHLAAPVDHRRVEQAARCFRSLTRAADGLVASAHAGSAVRIAPWWSQNWLRVKTCTKRTPRSTSRRAIRQRLPNSRSPGRRGRTSPRRRRLPREVERLLGGRLHAGGQLVAGDAGVQVELAGVSAEMVAVELVEVSRGSRSCGPPLQVRAADRG